MWKNETDYYLDFQTKFVHHSTAIEGNRLSESEVESILVKSRIPNNMSVQEFLEVYNHNMVFEYMNTESEAGVELSIPVILEIHRLGTRELLWNNGVFKKDSNEIKGANYPTATADSTPILMKQWCENLEYRIKELKNNDLLTDGERNIQLLELLLYFHIQFERIHPFSDGNGRVGRLLMVYVCMRENVMPFVIQSRDKSSYFRMLESGKTDEFLAYVLERQEKEVFTINLYRFN